MIVCLGGLITSLYVYIGEKIINPDKKSIINKKTNPFYPEDVAERANNFFIFAMIVMPITTIISLFLFYKFEKPKEIDNSKELKKEELLNSQQENKIESKKENDANTKDIILIFGEIW